MNALPQNIAGEVTARRSEPPKPGEGPTPWTSVVFAIGMLLLGIAAVVYVLNGPPGEQPQLPAVPLSSPRR